MIANHTLWLYFVTWNVATQQPSQEPWELLGIDQNGSGNSPDFFVVGLQEVRARPRDALYRIFFEDPWRRWLSEALSDKDYVNIQTKKMQGLELNVFCLRKHVVHLRQIETRSTKIGFRGTWGNKGAVSVRFNIYGVSICILNAHLRPHYENLDDRISDYRTILDKHGRSKIFENDYLFWVGDLNFRLSDDNLTPEKISTLVTKKQLDFLLKRDQLRSVMKSGEAFGEFTEGNITFRPTYKFEFPSTKYDLERRPSWTDRILYRVGKNGNLKANEYNYTSHPYYTSSDHIPVTAEFAITTPLDYEPYKAEFVPIGKWLVGEKNSATVKLLGGARATSDDWVGLYDEGFSSLDDYVDKKHIGSDKTDVWPQLKMEIRKIIFDDDALKKAGTYCLVYVARDEHGIKNVLGMSLPFQGISREN